MPIDVDIMLATRKRTHGPYVDVARTTMEATALFKACEPNASDVVAFTVFNICHKLARATHGDPYERDHWLDIAGYATRMVEAADARNFPPVACAVQNPPVAVETLQTSTAGAAKGSF